MWHKIEIVGHLGKDPEARYTPKGELVVNMSIAVDNWNGKSKVTMWFRATAWGETAENANKYLHKGSEVLVIGRLVSDEKGNPKAFLRQDGSAGASFEVTADRIIYLGKSEGKDSRQEDDGSVF